MKNISHIKGHETFVSMEPILQGMSGDQKYRIQTADDRRLLLRVADICEQERKKAEFMAAKQMAASGVPMPQPLDFGVCNDGKSVFTLLTWIDGDEVEKRLPAMPHAAQYDLGVQSGQILQQIHSVPFRADAPEWSVRYFSVIDARLEAFCREGVKFDGHDLILAYLQNNRHLLKDAPQCRHHGDYHTGNMVLDTSGQLHIIDWHFVDFDNYGDPWYEFNRIGGAFPAFASGQIDGYFEGGQPPEKFWKVFAYYLSASAITSIVWAKYFAPGELDAILRLNRQMLCWFDSMNDPVPTWYAGKLGKRHQLMT